MRAGREAEAEPIWAAVRAAAPEDVWVYNNAGLEYANVGAYNTALDWLTDGLRLALRTGDSEHLVDQLADLRRISLDNLGLPADELQDKAATFLREQEQTRPSWTPEPANPRTNVRMAVAWIPAGDYEQALQLWPEFAASDLIASPDGPLPHALYCRAMQRKLVAYSESGQPTFTVVPIRIDPYTAWCTEQNQQPDSADVRAEYVAHLTATGDLGLTAWPPGRNDRCWCGSGVKYKKCCAATSFVDRQPK